MKITYGNKTGLIPKGVQNNEWWDDDANEVKNVVNANDSVEVGTAYPIALDRIQGRRYGTWGIPMVGEIFVDTTNWVEGACAVVIWSGSTSPIISGATIQTYSGEITVQGVYSIYIHYLNNRMNVNAFNVDGSHTPPPSAFGLSFSQSFTDQVDYTIPFVSGTDYYIKTRCKLNAINSLGNNSLIGAYDTGYTGNFRAYFGRTTAGTLTGGFEGSGLNSSDTILLDTWYEIEIRYIGASDYALLYLDGVNVAGPTPVLLSSDYNISYPIGKYSGTSPIQNADWTIDWIDLNGDKYEFNEGTGGVVYALISGAHNITTDRNVEDMWVDLS